MTTGVAGLGVDLVRVQRFRRFVTEEKQALLERLFTAGELDYAGRMKDPAPHLAARFAAKEAFLKALGTGLRDGIRWHDMEVVRDRLGKPDLRLGGKAAEWMLNKGATDVHLSYSHDGDYATATVILECPCGC